MKVLMFGWEFPPFHQGGLGVACHGLVKGLSGKNIEICLVLPDDVSEHAAKAGQLDFVRVVRLKNVRIKRIASGLHEYITSSQYEKSNRQTLPNSSRARGSSLFEEVDNYTREAARIAEDEDFDIIHAHDWMTYGAGIIAKKISGKKLVIHVHATEIDRTGGNSVNQYVYDKERKGMHAADAIIAVSNFTKNMIVKHYGISPEKVFVVHNAVDFDFRHSEKNRLGDNKIVLFLARITLQKGPDYFLHAAKKVLQHMDNVIFIIAGKGDMEHKIIEKAAELNIADKVLFAGWLVGEDINKAYSNADIYVMPSVSEPFGIAPLEAMARKVPVVISKQSGVSEIVKHCFKVDFWDIDFMANCIIGILSYPELQKEMSGNAFHEVSRMSWGKQAEKCIQVYHQARAVTGVKNG